jgi:hypothetical protein
VVGSSQQGGTMQLRMRIRYSDLEQSVLDLIPEDGRKINTLEITGQIYQPGKAPINARQTVLNAANKLIFKSDENEEPWEIFKSRPRGSQPVYFWREARKNNEKKT